MNRKTLYRNVSIYEKDYVRLKGIQERTGKTLSEIVDELCELDFKYNPVLKREEFEIVTESSSYLFKVEFKRDVFYVSYYIRHEMFSDDLKDLELPDKVRIEFEKFICSEYAYSFLYYFPVSIEFENFVIFKL